MGALTANQLCPRDLLPPEAKCLVTTDDGTAGVKGLVTNYIPDHIDWADQIFACGPVPMYRAMSAQNLEIKPTQISLEMRMGCGLGTCYSCSLKTKSGLKQVCQDGPVFDLADILWDKLDS